VDNRIVGIWKLVDSSARGPDGAAMPRPYGPEGMGLVTFKPNGRMMAVLNDARAVVPEGVVREYVSYSGTYTFDGQTLVTRVDGSSIARIALGGDQVRGVKFDGDDRMTLTPPPLAVAGVDVRRELVWERVSATAA
jgi:hypothetical protein